MDERLLLEAVQLKEVSRAGWLRVGVASAESVAAHSWGIAWLALTLCPDELDLQRVLAMAIVHDLPEIRVGDITPHDPVSKEEKQRREASAATALLGSQPRLLAAWREYDAHESPESRFVHQLDKLDMAIQALRYHQAQGIDTTEFIESAREKVPAAMWRLVERMMLTP